MTKEEFVEHNNIEEQAIFIGTDDEWDLYKKAIVGVTEDKCHIIYSYQKLVETLADSYMEENYDKDRDYVTEAMEMLDFNTLRFIPYLPKEYRPVIIYEVEEL